MKNKKMLFLNIIVAAAVIFSFVYVLAVGGSYPLRTFVMLPGDSDPPETEVIIENEGVVEYAGARMDNGELILDFKAIGKGETKMSFLREFSEEDGMISSHEYTLAVTSFGIIVDKTMDGVNFNGYIAVIISILVILLATLIVMLLTFVEQKKNGDFSYRMIACGGSAIYVSVLLLFSIYKMLNNVVDSFGVFLSNVSYTGMLLLVALMPIMLVLSVLLMISNIRLIRMEGRRPVNALGIIFGIVWFIGTMLTVGASSDLMMNIWIVPDELRSMLVYIIGYFECMFISTVACSYLATKYRPDPDRDYIIILGCGICADGSLTPLLRGRVDSALSFEQAQFEKTGKHAVFVPSGGQGSDEIISESEAMSRYILSRDVPADRILKEDKSTNTFENMKFSKAVIESDCGDISGKKIAFATTNYHVFRGYILSKKNNFEAKGISAKTKFYFYPNAFLREFIGLIADRKWTILAAVAGILVFFSVVLSARF